MRKSKQKPKKIIKEGLRQIISQPWDRIYKFYSDKDEKDFKAGQLVTKEEIKDYSIKEKFLEKKGKEKKKIFKGSSKEFILAKNIGKEKIQREEKMEQEIMEKAIKDVEKLSKNYLDGGAKKGIAKTALEAIREIAELALKRQFIKK